MVTIRNEKKDDTMTDLHVTLDTVYRAFAGEPRLLDEVVTPDWEDLPPAPGQQPGPSGARPIIDAMSAALSGLRITVHDVVDGRDTQGAGVVAVRAAMTGVHVGELMGVEASGRQVTIALHEFHQVQYGMIRRTWHLEDWFGFFQQVGNMPPSDPRA